MPDHETTEGDHVGKRACDQCRLRKIRCDKESPCANCRTANRTCSSTGAGQRPKEARQRVLISTQYERKIDHFESRLENIENMLRELTVSLHSSRSPSVSVADASGPVGPAGPVPGTAVPPGPSPSGGGADGADKTLYGPDNGEDDAVSAFEGDSSMTAQTVFASEFLEHAVTRTLPADLDADMRSALNSLHQIVSMQNRPSPHESRFVNARPLPKGGVRELPMPPAHVVVAALREVKDNPLVSFATICTFVAADNFTEQCRRVYFATDDYSLMTWGVVNAGLYFLFQEKASLASSATTSDAGSAQRRAQFLEYQSLCRDNLETALSNLPLLLPARKESIEVLVLGALYAVEISKFSLARDLAATAATLCQNQGYHRIRTLTADTQAKAILFWAVYLLDKALSLRSGRAPVIQDYDITVPRRWWGDGGGNGNVGEEEDDDDDDDGTSGWRRILEQWIAYADFLGRAYEQLYSPAALTRPVEERAESARSLIATLLNWSKKHELLMRHIREKLQGTKFGAESPYSMDMAIAGDEVLHWSALTLIYRAIPSPPGSPSAFNSECIHAARQAFASHQEYMEMAGESMALKAGYIRWNIIYIPFFPVIVLFCHIVETSDDGDDLARLAAFVDSLQPVCAASESVAKLHRVCQVLHNVASLCVRARAQRLRDPLGQHGQDMAMVGNNIDMYLSQLGFMPPPPPQPQPQPQQQQQQQFGGGGGGAGHGQPSPMVGATAQMGGEGDGMAGAEFGAGYANELGNWFSGNTHILGLLEEDLSQFEPQIW